MQVQTPLQKLMTITGMDAELFENENEFPIVSCPICHQVLERPMKDKCPNKAHIFCDQCIIEWLKVSKTCPISRSRIRKRHLKLDRKTENRICDLIIKCPNFKKGCTKKGKSHIVLEHYNKCENGKIFTQICSPRSSLTMDRDLSSSFFIKINTDKKSTMTTKVKTITFGFAKNLKLCDSDNFLTSIGVEFTTTQKSQNSFNRSIKVISDKLKFKNIDWKGEQRFDIDEHDKLLSIQLYKYQHFYCGIRFLTEKTMEYFGTTHDDTTVETLVFPKDLEFVGFSGNSDTFISALSLITEGQIDNTIDETHSDEESEAFSFLSDDRVYQTSFSN